jgi:two-component system phosphate regulon sensor histidine kinase PhoR
VTDAVIASELLDALAEATLIVGGGKVLAANQPARRLLGESIEGMALAEAIPHPGARLLLDRPTSENGEGVELSGLGDAKRHWLMRVADLPHGARLLRFLDRSEARAAEQMRVDFVANASHELRTPLATLVGYTETCANEPPRSTPKPASASCPSFTTRRCGCNASSRT